MLSVTASKGFVVLARARATAEGKNMTEVIKATEEVRSKVTFLILVDTIRYGYRTGCITKVAAQVGSMLNIRPILTISSGLVRFCGAVRSWGRGINRILQMVKDKLGQKPVHVEVMHANAPDEAIVLSN